MPDITHRAPPLSFRGVPLSLLPEAASELEVLLYPKNQRQQNWAFEYHLRDFLPLQKLLFRTPEVAMLHSGIVQNFPVLNPKVTLDLVKKLGPIESRNLVDFVDFVRNSGATVTPHPDNIRSVEYAIQTMQEASPQWGTDERIFANPPPGLRKRLTGHTGSAATVNQADFAKTVTPAKEGFGS